MIKLLLVPLLVFITAALGSWFTSQGLADWYQTINLPSWTPGGGIIGAVWTTIFILISVAGMIFLSRASIDKRFWWAVALFVVNLFLNAFWSYLFFTAHQLGAAVFEAAFLGATVFGLIYLFWPASRLAALLFLPYGLWVIFATYLTFSVWRLN